MPQAAPLTPPDAVATIGPAEASVATAPNTEDQLQKAERRAQLQREGEGLTRCYVPDSTLLTVVVYAGTTAVVLAFLFGFGLLLFDKRKASDPKGWRAQLRGRF